MPHVKYILPSILILIFSLKGSCNFYCIPYYILSHCRSSLILTASVLHGPADVSIIFLIVFCVLPQTLCHNGFVQTNPVKSIDILPTSELG